MLDEVRSKIPPGPPRVGATVALAEGATQTDVIVGRQVDGKQTSRSIRDTSLYAASLGLFGVLAGLALITPLNAFADDILTDPLGGNWSARFLAIGLLAITGVALHIVTAEMGAKTLSVSSAERHPTLPGMRWFTGYNAALTDMWLGAVLVIFLIILAAAIPRGVTTFLAAYVIFLVWDGFFQVIYLLRNRTWARLTWRSAVNPLALVRQAESERHVPAYPDDLDALIRGDNEGVELMIARTAWADIWESLALLALSALLWFVVSNSPTLAATGAFVWLVAVIARIVLDYRLFPQFFAA